MSDFEVVRREKQEPSPALFARVVVCFALFLGGLFLIGTAMSGGNEDAAPWLFVGGILAVSLAFGLPMAGAHER